MNNNSDLTSWIGKQEKSYSDIITQRMADSLKVTLGNHRCKKYECPVGIFWCLAPALVEPKGLGHDGHPAKGGFLPPVSLPRRMWAGGELEFFSPLKTGDEVLRHSTISDIAWKSGKSGELCFVTVTHEYLANGEIAVREKQNLVYRAAATGPSPAPQPTLNNTDFDQEWAVDIDNTMLFRYSALTFNGHRIHYDVDYAREKEFYSGLVIHGPLQATLMLNLAVETIGTLPKKFSFRGVSPATGAQSMRVGMKRDNEGAMLSIFSESGVETMTGSAQW